MEMFANIAITLNLIRVHVHDPKCISLLEVLKYSRLGSSKLYIVQEVENPQIGQKGPVRVRISTTYIMYNRKFIYLHIITYAP